MGNTCAGFDKRLQSFLAGHPDITNKTEIARQLDVTRSSLRRALKRLGLQLAASSPQASASALPQRGITYTEGDNSATLTSVSARIKTVAEALRKGQVDTRVWEPDRFVVNSWEVGSKDCDGEVRVTPLWQIKVWLKRKSPQQQSLETLIDDLQNHAPIVPKIKRPKPQRKLHRALEVSILDPHFGMRCFQPSADHAWDMDTCETMVMTCIDRLLADANSYGPFDEIVFPFGNDFLHCDNIFHTTTAGTGQPEADSWHEMYLRGEKLALAMVEALKSVAPVHILVIPGNHARQSEFTMGRLLNAYYHRDKNVNIDASSSPYKFWRYGVNLLGFEHGHSVRPAIRLAALMANECREAWGETVFREWHIGDQHRKASSKPSAFEEQGVSIEYLPGLTAPNEWHKIKSYNWQKRAALAYVWDKSAGPVARLQVNIDSYTGKIMRAEV